MCNEENAEVCECLLHQYTSVTRIRKMNNCVLNEVLFQLMKLTCIESKATFHTRSVLTHNFKRNRIRASNLGKIRKTSRRKKNETTRNKKYPVSLKTIENLDSKNVKKKIDSIQNGTNGKTPEKSNKVPIVYLKDILSTQGRTDKTSFMEYFGLKAVNVPLSSDMGIKMAARDNHIVSEKFKLYKIGRCEQYINRNLTVKKVIKGCKSRGHLSSNIKKKCAEKYYKPVSVKVIRLDLNKIRRNMAERKKYVISKLKKQMQKNVENLKVIINPCEKKIVDMLLKKKFDE